VTLGLVLGLVYLSNGREIDSYDTHGASILPLTILRGDGFYLDRYWIVFREEGNKIPSNLATFGDHLISRHPVTPALIALPLVAPQVAFLDLTAPGWDSHPARAFVVCRRMAKRAAAILAASTAVVLYQLLRRMGVGRAALPAVLAAALGSDLWNVASQALWQHGPAALALTLSIFLLSPRSPSRGRVALAGLTTSALVMSRAINLIFAAVILAWVVRTHPRKLAWFLPGPCACALFLVGTNFWFFGTIAGGQSQLEQLHAESHAVAGPWSGDLLGGAAGTLLSPNRGLFVFSPWIAVALAITPAVARRLAPWTLVCWLLWALVPYGLVLSKYAVWWAGHSFGPRYWTDAIPLFAILLAFGLRWSLERCRAAGMILAATILISVGLQAIGAFCYPSSWNVLPANVDTHHGRLWDWRDTELSRCLIESMK
jgi:hypothetical protein